MEKTVDIYEYRPKKVMLIYLLSSAFCLLIFLVYNIFSHGVLSFFMTFLFIWPLVFGFLPAFVLYIIMKKKPFILRSRIPARLYRSGVASITMTSLLQGIFEIAGTDSIYTVILLSIGIGFLGVGGIGSLCTLRKYHGSYGKNCNLG